MAEIFTDRELKHQIETLISTSKKFLFIVSPYIEIGDDIKSAIKEIPKEVPKTVIYRRNENREDKSGIDNDSRTFLKSMSNIEFVSVDNLHAKFFFNEEYALISTMNLTKSSEYNFEIGVSIDRGDDIELYKEVLEYFAKILESDKSDITKERVKNILPKLPFTIDIFGTKIKLNGKTISSDEFKELQKNCNVKHGFCIRCSNEKIDFDPLKPYCKDCFNVWNKFKNKDFPEKYCHRCGRLVKVYIDQTLCEACFYIFNHELEVEWEKLNN